MAAGISARITGYCSLSICQASLEARIKNLLGLKGEEKSLSV